MLVQKTAATENPEYYLMLKAAGLNYCDIVQSSADPPNTIVQVYPVLLFSAIDYIS
jgi:hypothetical protein